MFRRRVLGSTILTMLKHLLLRLVCKSNCFNGLQRESGKAPEAATPTEAESDAAVVVSAAAECRAPCVRPSDQTSKSIKSATRYASCGREEFATPVATSSLSPQYPAAFRDQFGATPVRSSKSNDLAIPPLSCVICRSAGRPHCTAQSEVRALRYSSTASLYGIR